MLHSHIDFNKIKKIKKQLVAKGFVWKYTKRGNQKPYIGEGQIIQYSTQTKHTDKQYSTKHYTEH